MIKFGLGVLALVISITGWVFGAYLIISYADGSANVPPGDDPLQFLWRIAFTVFFFVMTWAVIALLVNEAFD